MSFTFPKYFFAEALILFEVETGSLSSSFESFEETELPSTSVGGTAESDVPDFVCFCFDFFVGNLGFLVEPEVSEVVVLELGLELVRVAFLPDFLVGSFLLSFLWVSNCLKL